MCQIADYFAIKSGDMKRLNMVEEGKWTDLKKESGKLENPGKEFAQSCFSQSCFMLDSLTQSRTRMVFSIL